MRAPAISRKMRGHGLAEYETRYINVKDPPFRARGDAQTDDTAAIQSAINAALCSSIDPSPVFIPPGTYMVSNLLLPAPCTLIGFAQKFPQLWMIAGSVGNMIEDNGSAQGVLIRNLFLNGKSCNASGIVLGQNTYQHGSGAILHNIVVRNFQQYGIDVVGNAARYENLICTGQNPGDDTKIRIDGPANRCWALEHTCLDADYGIEIIGNGNVCVGTHTEGIYTTGAIFVDGDNNQLFGTTMSVPGGETLPAAIVINTAAYGSQINGLSVILEPAATVTAMIIDNSYAAGMRIFDGQTGSASFRFIDHYKSGRERCLVPFNTGATGIPVAGTWRKGDVSDFRESEFGEPRDYVCAVAGNPGTWIPSRVLPGAIIKNSDYDVLAESDNGKRFSNEGDDGTIVFSLPAATKGQTYHFIRIADEDLRVDPDGVEVIRGGAGGKYLQLDAPGDNVTLMCIVDGKWDILNQVGTPSFEV